MSKWLLGASFFVAALGLFSLSVWISYQKYTLVPVNILHARIIEHQPGGRNAGSGISVDVEYEYTIGNARFVSVVFECKWYGQYLMLGVNSYEENKKKIEYVSLLNSGIKFFAWVSVNNPRHACLHRDGRFAFVNGEEKRGVN